MADFVRGFSYSRSLTTNYSLPLFLPPKRYYSSTLHSHNSRITRTKRSFFKPSPFTASASEIDVISTHQHSDGSFLFRFGDPSEIQKNVEMEEPKTVEEETEGEGSKLTEGDDEAKAIASGLTEVSDHADSMVSSSNSVIAVDVEGEDTEKLSEDDIELPALTSNNEMEGISTPDLNIQRIENVEDRNEEFKGTSLVGTSIPDESSKIENSIGILEVSVAESLEETSNATFTCKEREITSIPGVDVEKLTVNVEEFLEQEDSHSDASILGQSSEVVDNATTVALSANESDDITTSDIDTDQSGKLEECQNEDDEDSSLDTASVFDKSSVMVNGTSTVALLENESDNITSTSDIKIEPTGDVEESVNEEYEDSSVVMSVLDNGSEVLNIITTETSSEEEIVDTITSDTEKEPTINGEDIKNEDYNDSPVDTSLLDNSSEVLNTITTDALSEKETDVVAFISNIEIEPTGNVEERINEEYKDSLVDTSELNKSSEVINLITTEASSEMETDSITFTSGSKMEPTGHVEEGINVEYDDSPAETSVLDKESSEKETAKINSAPDIDIECTGSVEQGLDEILEEPSSADASRPDKRPEVENNITAHDFLGKETANATTLVIFNTDPVVAVLDTDSYQGSLETSYTTKASPVAEHLNEESVIQDESIVDNGESLDNNLPSPSPQLEPAMSLNEETEEPISQSELQKFAIEESCETNMNNIKAIEMQNVLRKDNESELYGAEAKSQTVEPAMICSTASEEQASGSGSGIPDKTVEFASEEDMFQLLTGPPRLEAESMLEEETGTETVEKPWDDDASENQTVGVDLVEASIHEAIAPESAESAMTSQEKLTTDFVLSSGAALLHHPSKVLTGGEDAYFITGQTWLGLADGVSQWSLEGTTVGVYAKELIKNCEKLVSDSSGNSINNPMELLNLSVAQTHSPGSSTVLIAQFDGKALHVANVGDSGFIVLRHGAVYKRSSPMHHAFSFPVHIDRDGDLSCITQLYRVDLEEEDLIVLATDGLFDNLYDQELSSIAMKSLADQKSPEEIAVLLARRAQEVGSSASGRSPFADDAQAAGFPGHSGGKLDDVSVIVSLVQRRG